MTLNTPTYLPFASFLLNRKKATFTGVPYQSYGLVTGKVIEISADAKPDQQSGSFYQVRVSLDRDYVNSNSGKVTFKAGQTANAEIVIRHRRIIDVLLDPIQQMRTGGNTL